MRHIVNIKDLEGYTSKTIICSSTNKRLEMKVDPINNNIIFILIDKTTDCANYTSFNGDSFDKAIEKYNEI